MLPAKAGNVIITEAFIQFPWHYTFFGITLYPSSRSICVSMWEGTRIRASVGTVNSQEAKQAIRARALVCGSQALRD